MAYEVMRREYGMSDAEFWDELSLARLFRLMELRRARMEAAAYSPDDDVEQQIAALDAAGL